MSSIRAERWLGANTPAHGIELALAECVLEVSGACVDPDDVETAVIPDGDGYIITARFNPHSDD